jgi:uncharacterized protein YjbI with pentapeptide repeats
LDDADLGGANLSRAHLRNARFWRAGLRGANLSQANLRNASFLEADLTDAVFAGVDLSRTSFAYANLENADLRQTTAYAGGAAERHAFCVNLSHANLHGAKVDSGLPVDLAAVKPDGAVTG